MTVRPAYLAVGALLLAPIAHAAGVDASSGLTDEAGTRHEAEEAFDGRLQTSWCEGATGVGEGSWIELRFDKPIPLSSISIWPGDLSNGVRGLKEGGRPRRVELSIDGGEPIEIAFRDGAEHGEQRVDTALQGQGKVLRLTVTDAMAGWLRNDTCIAEVAVNLLVGDRGASAKLDAWVASAAGEKAADAQRTAVIDRFDRITGTEFGDSDALHELLDWAADGAPYLRDRVRREIAPGFRVAALPGDDVAIEALLKIQDANAIPALTLAALRRVGDDQRKLLGKTSYLAALTELKAGGRRSLPLWGAEGWERGALRSFGEPEGIARGADELLYVADLANHRVVVFDDSGRVLGQWGKGEPGVTDAWFDRRRKHYVSGRQPGVESGAFTNPVAITTKADKDGVHVYVLDATGRVQVLGEKGKAEGVFTLEARPEAGQGGGGHLVATKKGVVAIVGQDAFVLGPDGAVVKTWRVEEGAPITVAPLKNGHLALGFAAGAADYDLDGYRHATLLESADLPLGLEGWSLATDAKGGLWVVTDNGWVVSYKKPGVEAFRLRWSEVGGRAPRFVVDDGVLWIVADGVIHRFDALEAKAQAAAGAAGE